MTEKLRVFFDGGCPLCRKEISVYRKTDKADRIDWVDVSAEQQRLPLPLPRQALLARFHVQTTDGRLVSGAHGFVEMWRQLPKWRWLARACSFPGVPSLLEIGYQGFLKVRPALQRAFR
jgi:predicted DCC family thiol-disulfide oxidoreductase YuxK